MVNCFDYVLLFFYSFLTVCSEIPFGESLCYIGTSPFISALRDSTRFCLMWGLIELNFRSSLRTIFVLCVLFYKPTFAIICLSETCLNSEIRFDDKNLKISGYNLVREDPPSNSKREGVCVYYRNPLAFKVINVKYL